MSQGGNSGIGRIYIKVGSDIIDLTGTAKEVQEDWLKIKEEDSWEEKLLTIKKARDSAVQIAAPKSGSKWNTRKRFCFQKSVRFVQY